MEWFETWGLTVIVFLPVVGAVLLGFITKENEDALKRTALLFSVLAFIASIAVVVGQFDFGGASYNTYQFEVDEPWIGADQRQLSPGNRRDKPSPARPLDVRDGPGGDLLLEPLGGAEEPEGLPDPDDDPGHRYERDVRRARPRPVLHLLRDGAGPDVLHDRDLG